MLRHHHSNLFSYIQVENLCGGQRPFSRICDKRTLGWELSLPLESNYKNRLLQGWSSALYCDKTSENECLYRYVKQKRIHKTINLKCELVQSRKAAQTEGYRKSLNKCRARLNRVFVKTCYNRDLFPSKRDQNGGYAAISCYAVASGGRRGRGSPPSHWGLRGTRHR